MSKHLNDNDVKEDFANIIKKVELGQDLTIKEVERREQ
ncbi:hypothetical protein AN618_16270 [Fervidicola ferrireducens]|uniref:Uncharacterized protein n=1 Tax=Fervidicola ferrireducens TaxID=520764 RepID=A0A140L762_9FIRM|nr:hypothetical protein AN618_16270 [Fervidicola ferrireducens]